VSLPLASGVSRPAVDVEGVAVDGYLRLPPRLGGRLYEKDDDDQSEEETQPDPLFHDGGPPHPVGHSCPPHHKGVGGALLPRAPKRGTPAPLRCAGKLLARLGRSSAL